MVSRKHHLVKSVVYRIYATIVSILVLQLFTGNWVESASIGAVLNFVKVFTYYIYERLWFHATK
ncbi:MAG: DUF2061 domain-containing protein [Candidatus Hydrothermarchaeales archaeon]